MTLIKFDYTLKYLTHYKKIIITGRIPASKSKSPDTLYTPLSLHPQIPIPLEARCYPWAPSITCITCSSRASMWVHGRTDTRRKSTRASAQPAQAGAWLLRSRSRRGSERLRGSFLRGRAAEGSLARRQIHAHSSALYRSAGST